MLIENTLKPEPKHGGLGENNKSRRIARTHFGHGNGCREQISRRKILLKDNDVETLIAVVRELDKLSQRKDK